MTISLFKTAPFSFEIFKGADFKELVLNLLFFFFFAWLVMQFNANWGHAFKERSMAFKIGLFILVNIGILVGTVSLYKLVAPYFTGEAISERENDFLNFIFTIHFIILFFISRILRLQVYQRVNQETFLYVPIYFAKWRPRYGNRGRGAQIFGELLLFDQDAL